MLAGSCKPHVTTTKTSITVSSNSLNEVSILEFPNAQIYTLDNNYITVNLKWLQNEYYKEFKTKLFEDGIAKWDAVFDCDKFARYFTDYLQTKFLKENYHNGQGKPQSVAVGVLCYKVGGIVDRGHAINIIWTEDGTFMYLEPQTGAEVGLTKVEKNSAFLILW